MARISGTTGTVNFGGAITGITDWTINSVGDMPDATGMDSSIDEYVRGLRSYTISCNGRWEGGAAPDPGTDVPGAAVAFLFGDGQGTTYNGNAFMTRFHVEATIDGVVDFSLEAQGTGALST